MLIEQQFNKVFPLLAVQQGGDDKNKKDKDTSNYGNDNKSSQEPSQENNSGITVVKQK